MNSRRMRASFSPSFDRLGARIAPSTFSPPPDPYGSDSSVVMTGLSESSSCDSGPTTYTCGGDTMVMNGPPAS